MGTMRSWNSWLFSQLPLPCGLSATGLLLMKTSSGPPYPGNLPKPSSWHDRPLLEFQGSFMLTLIPILHHSVSQLTHLLLAKTVNYFIKGLCLLFFFLTLHSTQQAITVHLLSATPLIILVRLIKVCPQEGSIKSRDRKRRNTWLSPLCVRWCGTGTLEFLG